MTDDEEGTDVHDDRLLGAVRGLLGEIEVLSADFGPTVQEAIAMAKTSPLDPQQAERLHTRVLRILREATLDHHDELQP